MTKSDVNSLDVYSALGIELKKAGSQLLGDCPFCGKEDKLYVDPATSKFKCHRCGTFGNNRTVMNRLHEDVWKPALTPQLKSFFAKSRNLPVEAVNLDDDLGFDVEGNKFTWLARNPDGVAQCVRTRARPAKYRTKVQTRSLKGVKVGLVGAEALGDASRRDEPIYIVEGEPDRVSMLWVLNEVGEDGIVVAVPGSTTFKKEWREWFEGRTVFVVFDKDQGGEEGTVRIYKILLGVAKVLKFCHWPEEMPHGVDVNDIVSENLDDPSLVLEAIDVNLKAEPTGELNDNDKQQAQAVVDTRQNEQEELEPITLEELYKTFDKWLKIDNYDILDIAMATVWSSLLPGNQLWMFLVAPPSGLKSEVIMPISKYFRVHGMSQMKATSLVSGFNITPDPSLLHKMNGKHSVLAIKDMTPLLQMRDVEREEVFGILRDAYDGVFQKQYGNGLVRAYEDLHFAILAGVTPSIDMYNDVAMGERFLKFRAERSNDRDSSDDIDKAMRAVMNGGNETNMKIELADACVRSLLRDYDISDVPQPSEEMARWVSTLALAVARLRAVAPTEKGTDLQTMDPMAEVPARLATQFAKLAKGLAMHYGIDTLEDDRIRGLVRRVALHTLHPVGTSVLQVLYHFQQNKEYEKVGGLAIGEVAEKRYKLLSRETTSTYLRMYHRTKVVYMTEDGPAKRYRLCDWAYDLLRKTEIFDNLPKHDPFYRRSLPAVGKTQKPKRAKRSLKVKRRS